MGYLFGKAVAEGGAGVGILHQQGGMRMDKRVRWGERGDGGLNVSVLLPDSGRELNVYLSDGRRNEPIVMVEIPNGLRVAVDRLGDVSVTNESREGVHE